MNSSFEKEVIVRLTKIETKLDDYAQIKNDSSKALRLSETNSCDIKEIQDNNKWLWRTIFVAILGFISSILLIFVKIN